jgi:hypothetical protein
VPAKNAQGKKLGGIRAKSIQTRDEARAHAKTLRPVLAELAGMTARYAPFAAVLTGMMTL